MRYGVWIAVLFLLAACQREPVLQEPQPDAPYMLEIPPGFPPMPVPEDNKLTVARVELGKRLFFDKQLSSDFSISCASCHEPEMAFAHDVAVSSGVGGAIGTRNSPTLANVGYQQAFFAEGGIPTLELQVIAPITEAHEMNMTFEALTERLSEDATYREAFDRAYGGISAANIAKALSSFQRTLISGNSPYDQHVFQGKDVLSEAALRGMDLFFSDEASCGNCHSGHLLSNEGFENIGLYHDYLDPGRMLLTELPEDAGRFKVPTLRNVALTAPYMHDGSIETLEEVVEHFNLGGVGHPNQSEWVRPLNLSEQQRADLVAFLHALTDMRFIEKFDQP